MRSRSLPSKLWINHKLNNSCTHRDLMDKVQRNFSKKVVSLGEISEKLLQNIGYSSISNSQISDLAKKLADENRLNGSVENIYIWKDQAARLSTKAIGDLYVKMPLSREEIGQLEQGFLTVKGENFSTNLVEKRMKEQISNGSIEVIQSSNQTNIVCTNSKSIECISKEYASELKALLEWSKKLLPSINEKELLSIWARSRLQLKAHDKESSLGTRTYTLQEARQTINIYKRVDSSLASALDLIRFAHSLDKQGARAFIFSNDKDSLEFLFAQGYNYFHTVTSDTQKNALKFLQKLFIN